MIWEIKLVTTNMQKSISKSTTRLTLKQMGQSSRPHFMLHLSAKNSKLKQHLAEAKPKIG